MNIYAQILRKINYRFENHLISEKEDIRQRSALLRYMLVRNGELGPGKAARPLLVTAMPRKKSKLSLNEAVAWHECFPSKKNCYICGD